MAVFCSAISSLVGCGTSLGFLGDRHSTRVHLSFAKVFVGAKHCGSKSLMITNKLSAAMLRPYTH